MNILDNQSDLLLTPNLAGNLGVRYSLANIATPRRASANMTVRHNATKLSFFQRRPY